jgi:homoserine dehydrogenase
MSARIGLVGCGTVGRGLLELLDSKESYLEEKYGARFDLIFAADAVKGTVFKGDGIDPGSLVAALDKNGTFNGHPAALGSVGLPDLLRDARADIICEATPTDYKTGEPGMTIISAALRAGASVVTSSKGALGLDMAGLKRLARENGVSLRFESSVMSGTPLIGLVRGPLAGCAVSKVEGILNGTTNYILTKMESGKSYDDALAEAKRLGYAEADPTGDVEGYDAAIKVCIMAAEFFETPLRMEDVKRTGITSVTLDVVHRAAESGGRVKLIAGVKKEGGAVAGYVEPRTVSLSNPLASVPGATNAVNITTDLLGEITIVGPGAGKLETAQGLLSDMLDIVKVNR